MPRKTKPKRKPKCKIKPPKGGRRRKRAPKKAATKSKGGRPRNLLTPTLISGIVNTIRAGNYIETATALHGIHKDTFYRWLKEGARDRRAGRDTLEATFSDAIKKADAHAENARVSQIQKASKKIWTAAAWWLERRHPGKWGLKQRTELTGEGGAPIQVVFPKGIGFKREKKGS